MTNFPQCANYFVQQYNIRKSRFVSQRREDYADRNERVKNWLSIDNFRWSFSKLVWKCPRAIITTGIHVLGCCTGNRIMGEIPINMTMMHGSNIT